MSLGTQTQFGKYELVERLGAGGMAIVYRARYTAAPGVIKPVVIKRVLGHYAEDPEFVAMFVQEARISVGLNHGNIVQVFDFGQVEGEYFLAMELVEGQPLSAVLKRAQAQGMPRLPAPLAVLVAIEMCKGLHHAHTRNDEAGRPLGLVHRDISPDNVLVSYEGEVKISDFGIAKAQLAGRPVTEAGMVKGKVLYMSPEQMRGEQLDARSDVYAVGVVLYRMLCGRLPVEGGELEAMQRVVQGQLTHPRQLNPDLDGGLVQILMDALASKRDARIHSAEALHQELSHWLATRAPLFPVHTLKHLLGVLFEHELEALGRPPQLPPKFREQVALWSSGSTPEPTPVRPKPLRSATRATPVSMMAPAATQEQPAVTAQAPEQVATATDRAAVVHEADATDKAPATVEVLASEREFSRRDEDSEREDSGITLPERVPHFWLWVIGVAVATAVVVKLSWPLMFRVPPLEVSTEPPGALVQVDDTVHGVAPVTVKGLERGETHKVELSMPGMKPWGHVFLPGTLGEQLKVTLEPVRPAQRKPPEPAPPPEPSPAAEPTANTEPPPRAEDSFAARFGTEELPARFTLQEKWHSFSPTKRSFQHVLNPAWTYTVRTSGQYTGAAPMSEQDLGQGLSPAPFQSSQLFVFLEGEGVPGGDRLFKATTGPISFSGAQALHAFVIAGTSSERYVNRALTLHLRTQRAKRDISRPVDPRRYAHIVALENRYSVRKLDPQRTYALEVRSRQDAPSSAVAMVAVPPEVGGRIRVSGQVLGDFQYALQTGSYTVQGVRELWFSLPRWEQDGEARMDLSVEPLPAP